MRSFIVALLFVLACTVSVQASMEWSSPEVDAWASELSSTELEARHAEFIMNTEGSSSSAEAVVFTAAESSVSVSCLDCLTGDELRSAFAKLYDYNPEYINITTIILYRDDASSSSSASSVVETSSAEAAPAAAIPAAARRLLAMVAYGVKHIISIIYPEGEVGLKGRKIYAAIALSLACIGTPQETKCMDDAAAFVGLPTLSNSTTFKVLANNTIAGTIVVDAATLAEIQDDIKADVGGSKDVESTGGARRTNGGYYFLGAVTLLFALIAVVYFIVHKAPAAGTDGHKDEPLRRDEVALAPVVAVAGSQQGNSGVAVVEDQPLAAGQQQMDYRSVFALKHNVLDKNAEQKAAEDEHNHNDVHFILHQ